MPNSCGCGCLGEWAKLAEEAGPPVRRLVGAPSGLPLSPSLLLSPRQQLFWGPHWALTLPWLWEPRLASPPCEFARRGHVLHGCSSWQWHRTFKRLKKKTPKPALEDCHLYVLFPQLLEPRAGLGILSVLMKEIWKEVKCMVMVRCWCKAYPPLLAVPNTDKKIWHVRTFKISAATCSYTKS